MGVDFMNKVAPPTLEGKSHFVLKFTTKCEFAFGVGGATLGRFYEQGCPPNTRGVFENPCLFC